MDTALVVFVLYLSPSIPVGPVGPVGPVEPVGPSIPSKFTLYTTLADGENVPCKFVILEIVISPVVLL
jgi:hypothetical protein